MTIAEMHSLADLLIDKANAPWFSPEEKDRFLNLEINAYVKRKYSQFESDEKVRKDLLTLVSAPYSVASDIINLEVIPLADFLFVLRVECDITNSCGTKTGIPVKPAQHDDFAEAQRDPFNKADDSNPRYLESLNTLGERIIQVYSDNAPTTTRMVYLKQPVTVDINTPTDCNLPAHTHEEIVNGAVAKMLANIEGFEDYQVQLNEINKQE